MDEKIENTNSIPADLGEETLDARLTTPVRIAGEEEVEFSLRPKKLEDFVGQERLKENLSIFIQAAKSRDEPLTHVLFFGPPGLGKTTLAYIIANELGVDIIPTSGPVIERIGDLAGILTRLKSKDTFFIDEIHRLDKQAEEYLYPAMEDYRIEIMIDQGANARSVTLNLSPFTLIGATTRSGLLSAPMRSRFELTFRLDFYSPEDLELIVTRTAKLLETSIDKASAYEIARRARGTPRIANRLLKRIRDYAQVKGDGTINLELTRYALTQLNVDERGLDEMDEKILNTIIDKYQGGPVGLGTIGASIGEDPQTIEEMFEPYLLQQGFIKRTPKGRVATPIAYEHLGKKMKPASGGLFEK
ncbi:MAG: Holliday junction branch migration DNA helicase RuvB [bacterium]|nr:Holliday junction branch migration DNA helicase RuvB [bacterium]